MNSQLSKEFKNVCVVFQDRKYSIEVYTHENTGKSAIAVIKDQLHVEFPIIYWETRKVAYDKPELLPEYIKKKVESFAYNLD